MLSPDSRSLYTECLAAPLGYAFDHGVATTFTLDLETLLVLPFTLAMQNAADTSALLADPQMLLESLRATTDRLSVFHHVGYLAVPTKEQLLFQLLEDSVVPVRAPGGGIFHPKLWLLRFVHQDDGSPLLRAVVLSRNLTFDRSWDVVLCVEGEPTGRRTKDSFGLEALVAALPSMAELAGSRLSDARAARVRDLADEAARTRFDAPGPFSDQVRFHAVGVGGATFRPRLEGYGRRVLCVSPFVTKTALDQAGELADSEWILVSRDDQLDALTDDTLADWDLRVLGDDVETGDVADADAPTSDDVARRVPPRGLHAKLLAVEDTMRHVIWWVGSANLTHAGWDGTNVELMAELHTTQKHGGIDAFLDAGFAKLLVEWKRSEKDVEELARQAALDHAETLRDAIVAAGPRLVAEGADDRWTLRLEHAFEVPPEATVRVWPVTLHEATHARLLDAPPVWPALAPPSLTSLVAFEIRVRHEGAGATIRFGLKLPAEGFPDDRHAHLVRQIVSTRSGFFRYLRLLLAVASGALGALGLEGVLERRPTQGNGDGGGLPFEEVVLEDLLRTLSRDPDKLEPIDRLVRTLSSTAAGEELIPADFRALWQTVREVRAKGAK